MGGDSLRPYLKMQNLYCRDIDRHASPSLVKDKLERICPVKASRSFISSCSNALQPQPQQQLCFASKSRTQPHVTQHGFHWFIRSCTQQMLICTVVVCVVLVVQQQR
jgi:hypothetical protein